MLDNGVYIPLDANGRQSARNFRTSILLYSCLDTPVPHPYQCRYDHRSRSSNGNPVATYLVRRLIIVGLLDNDIYRLRF